MIEAALILPFLALMVFGVIDYGRLAAVQNRLAAGAREGAAVIQFRGTNVNTGCSGTLNVADQVAKEDVGLSGSGTGYTVTVAKRNTSGTYTTYTGCGTATNGVTVSPGDRIRVTVSVLYTTATPLLGAIRGNSFTVSKSVEVVVQG